jgi:uncharacterized protein YjbI with pentapeptide repeats
MNEPPADRCGYTWPEDYEAGDDFTHPSCCYRRTVSDEVDSCIWHVTNNDVDEKTVEALKDARTPLEIRKQTCSPVELLDGAKLSRATLYNKITFEETMLRDADFTDATVTGADFSESNLWNANLKSANLQDTTLNRTALPNADLTGATLQNATLNDANLAGADLSDTNLQGAVFADGHLPSATFVDAHLPGADFTDADLWGVDFTDANLEGADISDANLQDATLFRADLRHTTLSNTNFRNGSLTKADLREATIDNLAVNGATDATRLYEGKEFDATDWDATARAYNDLKTAFSDHGLSGRARSLYFKQRRARAQEAKAASGRFNRQYLGSLASRCFTGYGVKVQSLVAWMLLLFVTATVVYLYVGVEDTVMSNITYSVLAFTVAPPGSPSELGAPTQLVVMIETFLGTLSTVLLGYVLGNRERI